MTKNTVNFELKRLDIVGADGTVVDLIPAYTGVEIFESMYSTFITGFITFSDQQNMLEELPVIGDETIIIEYKDLPQTFSNNPTNHIRQEFDVVKVENMRVMSPHATSYTIRFMSKAYLNNSKKRIRKAYNARPCELTMDLVKRHLGSSTNWITQCQYDEKVVFPNVRPSEAIDMLAKLGVDADGSGDYMFYETTKGFNFVSSEWLIKQPIIAKYDNSIVTEYTEGAKDYKVEESYNTTPFDIVHNVTNGLYGNKIIQHSMVDKTIAEKTTTYSASYDKFTHLNNKSLTAKHAVGYEENAVKYIPVQPIGTEGVYGKTASWYGDFLSRATQFENNVWTLTINGDDRLVAGGVIQVKFPKRGAIIGDEAANVRESGKYMIVNLRRVISPNKYTSVVQAVGESINV